jgi:hypothetical protein
MFGLGLLVGLIVGGAVGVIVMAVIVTGARADERLEKHHEQPR